MSQNTDKILNSIDQNPSLLEGILNLDEAPLTRSGQRANPLLNVLGGNISNEEVNRINEELSSNPIIQLYSAAAGSLDAKDLLSYVGGTRGTRANNDMAVRALFDGRLDLKEIMLIIVLLKLFKRKNSHTYNNSAIGLLGTLLGFNTVSHNTNPFSSLLGGNGYGYGNQSNGLFNLFGSNVAGPWLGIDIVLNIVLMLFMFFATIEMKSYSLTLGYASVGIGIFQIIRIFMLPLSLLNVGSMKPAIFTTMLIMYVLSGTFAILAGFLSVYRGTALRKYLKTVKPIENEKVGK